MSVRRECRVLKARNERRDSEEWVELYAIIHHFQVTGMFCFTLGRIIIKLRPQPELLLLALLGSLGSLGSVTLHCSNANLKWLAQVHIDDDWPTSLRRNLQEPDHRSQTYQDSNHLHYSSLDFNTI